MARSIGPSIRNATFCYPVKFRNFILSAWLRTYIIR